MSRQECNGIISAPYNLCLPGSSDSSASASRGGGITGTCHHAWLIFLLLVETGFHLVGQGDPELLTLRSTHLGLPKCWDYRCEPRHPAWSFSILKQVHFKNKTKLAKKQNKQMVLFLFDIALPYASSFLSSLLQLNFLRLDYSHSLHFMSHLYQFVQFNSPSLPFCHQND